MTSNNLYFKLTKTELAKALHTLETLSSELDDYNISYFYDEELNEVPERLEDMNLYADVLISHSRIEFEKLEAERNWLQISGGLGMAGSLRKMTSKFEDAKNLLQASLWIISQKNLPEVYYIQQSIRLYDTYKRLGKYKDAIQGLSELALLCTKENSLTYYLDVAFQHLGKVQFSNGQFNQALQSFERALALRIQKKDQSLIDSSEQAIQICQKKLSHNG